MRKFYNWVIDKWLAGFITATIYFTLKYYIELPDSKKSNFISFSWIKDLLNSQVPIYILIIVVILIVFVTRLELWSKIRVDKEETEKPPQPSFLTYKSGVFGANKTKWTWDYKWDDYSYIYNVIDLRPSCSRCNNPVEINGYSNDGTCTKCRLDGLYSRVVIYEREYDVQAEIIRNIRKGVSNP